MMMKKKNLKPTKPKTASSRNHPSYFEMVKEALLSLNERKGSSQYAIAKFMEEKYKSSLPSNFRKILSTQLKNCVVKGKLKKIKASYKLLSPTAAKKFLKVKEQLQEDEKVDLENLETYVNVKMAEKISVKGLDKKKKFIMNNLPGFDWYEVLSRRREEDEDDDMKEKKRITTKRCKKYIQHVIDSQGFDMGEAEELPTEPMIVSRVRPVRYRPTIELLPDLCRDALAEFNTLNKTCFEFKNVVKANAITCAGCLMFVTFQANRPLTDPETLVTFQARGFHNKFYPEMRRIDFCRLKKDAYGLVETHQAFDAQDANGGLVVTHQASDAQGGGGPVMG